MATVRLVVRKSWLEGLRSNPGELCRVVENLAKKGRGDEAESFLVVECDVLHPLLAVIPDEAIERATYRGVREYFHLSPCVVQGSLGVSVQVTDPSADSGDGCRQIVSVYGTLHSQVRADFLAVWGGLRSPKDVGQPFAGVYDWTGQRTLPLKKAVEGAEREIILRVLKANGWSRRRTAVALDINRTTLFNKMRKYGLLLVGKPVS